jgi:hypothetical protein
MYKLSDIKVDEVTKFHGTNQFLGKSDSLLLEKYSLK